MNKLRMLGPALAGVLILALVVLSGCVPGATGASPQPGQEGGTSSLVTMIIFLVLIFGMFYLLIIRPQRKKQKQQQELQSHIKKGDRVITAGGIYGIIESISDDSLVIRVESGATMRVAKGSVMLRPER